MAQRGEDIGLAVIGCGPIGRIRAELARDYPGIGWLGVCDIREELARDLAQESDLVGRPCAATAHYQAEVAGAGGMNRGFQLFEGGEC